MYKRRKKTGVPQASSTVINNSLSSSRSLTQLSNVETQQTIGQVQSQRLFSDSESLSAIDADLNRHKNSISVKSSSKQNAVEKTSTDKLLEILSSPQQIFSTVDQNKTLEGRSIQPRNNLKSFDDFKDMLKDCGIILSKGCDHNVLMKDQAVFVRDLTKRLKCGGESCVIRFIKHLEEYLSDKDRFQRSLAPTKTDVDSNIARGAFQECFIRLLLTITILQTKLTQYLLDRLAELILADEDQTCNEGIMWVRLITPPLRYLPFNESTVTFTKTLFDIINAAPVVMLQHEIINCLPDIIGDEQRVTVVNELLELMRWKPLLTPSILSALNNICLEDDSLYEVKKNLIKSLRREPLDHIQLFVNFIIKSPVDGHIDEFLNGLRSELVICYAAGHSLEEYMRTRGANAEDISKTLVIIFDKLKDTVLMNTKLAEAWLKNITKVKCETAHKPIDLIMVLLLHATTTCISKKKIIETAVRARIRHGYFKQILIKDTISTLDCVLKQNFPDLLKFLSSLLQSSDIVVNNFASFFFAECFVQMENEYCKAIILQLMDVKVFWSIARPALSLLHELTTNHTAKMAPFISLIMRLLDIVSDLNVFEIRQLMDTVGLIVFGNPDHLPEEPTSLQNDVYMIVQKQLSCPEPSVFKSGVICSLMTIKHVVTMKEGEPNETPNSEEFQSKEGDPTEGSSTEIRIVLNTKSEKAYSLLELVLAATESISEAHELCLDQLSHIVLSSDNMDKAFMKKVSHEMQNSLQNHFIIASSEFLPKEDDLEASLQFCIDTDLEDPIVLNIADAVIKETKLKSPSPHKLVALPGLVRVIRGLQLADLTEIDALLGCYISFPHPTVFTKFSSLEQEIQFLVLDCLFHTSNWFREIINSFVYLVKEGSPDKVLMRLRLIVHLQTLIVSCLPQTVGYNPPKYLDTIKGVGQNKKKSLFNTLSQKRPNKKRKTTSGSTSTSGSGDSKEIRSSGTTDNEGNNAPVTQADDSSTEDEDSAQHIVIEFSYFQQYLRELDFDICLLLTQPLTIKPLPPKDGKFSPEFGPNELMLLLDDLNNKLLYRLKPKSILGKSRRLDSIEYNNFLSVPTDLIVKNTAKLTSHITNHLHKIVEYCYNLLKEHDDVYDAMGMFCSGTAEIKKCAALIFSILDSFFSWPELKSDTYMKCLMKAAVKLGGESADKLKSKPLNQVLQSAIKYLQTISKCMLDLSSAINLVTLIKTLNILQDDNDDKRDTDIGELCSQFLKRKWYDSNGTELKGNQLNKHQACLLELYLTTGENSLNNIRSVVTSISNEIDTLSNADSSFSLLPHFSKTNLHILIKSITKCLYNVAKNKIESSDLKEQFMFWDNIVDCLQDLVQIVKGHDTKINLRQLLKGCFPILKQFKTNGMSICSSMFKLDAILVTKTIKKLQVVTRYIQSVCNYSKVTKDRLILQQLPGIRGVLESIVLSVKSMVLLNKCTEAFFMGSMKNKDHHGDIITSQNSIDSNSMDTASSVSEVLVDVHVEEDEEEVDENCEEEENGSDGCDTTSVSEAY